MLATRHDQAIVQPAPARQLTSFYSIAGEILRVETSSDSVERWVERFLSGFHFFRTASPLNNLSSLTVRVSRSDLPEISDRLPSFDINRGVCYRDGSRYLLAVDQSLVIIHEPEKRLVEVCFGTSTHARHPVALVNAFSYGLQAALRRMHLFDLHAAGLSAPGSDRGGVFVGPAGSGKTTLSLRLIERGWRYLSDDMLLLVEPDYELEIRGLRRIFAVAPSSLTGRNNSRILAALGEPAASDPAKRKLDPDEVFLNAKAERARPQALFFVERTGGAETTLEPLAASSAMQKLVHFCPWATYDEITARAYLGRLARLSNQCRAYLLHAGCDVLDAPARVSTLIESGMKGSRV